jgi:hypothetical protein
LEQLKRFLEAHPGIEHIEAIDHTKGKWVTDGLHDERWQYRHFTSWRDNPGLFDRIWHLQRDLGFKVTPPDGIKPHFGSQWWTLSWPTISRILELAKTPAIRKFFLRTWVPDEMFFQTMVAKVVPKRRISGRNLNFYHFNKKGVPLVFHADHLDFLAAQPHFFARKIAPRSQFLRDRLEELASSRIGAPPPCVPIKKNLAHYEYFSALQYRGIPNRRVMGSQRDLWWGDMECNKRLYTAILAPESLDLTAVYRQFANRPGSICYGELFNPDRIDYGPHASPHPLYPPDAPLLRDLKKPNFLFDLIQSHPASHLVFSIRVPSHTEIPEMVLADLHCELAFVLAEQSFWDPNDCAKICWETPFNQMVLYDLYWRARKNGKQCPIFTPSLDDELKSSATA